MTTELHRAAAAAIRRHAMCAAGDRVAVAVSGGADSVALFRLLLDLRAELGISLAVAHFNHQLRGADSDADEAFVAELAARHDCPFVTSRADVAAAAAREGVNLEEMARRLRYQFFNSLVSDAHVKHVAVAHTADDQAETVLAHLLRGTGLTGLGGIHPVAGAVIRPLLHTRRAALREFLNNRGQAWREDATNQDTSRLRARIRHQLLPHLERDFQTGTVEHFATLSNLARDEEQMWQALTENALREFTVNAASGIEVPIARLLQPLPQLLQEHSQALTRRLIRRLVEAVAGHRRQLSAEHVEQVIRLATESASGRKVNLPSGVAVLRSFDRLTFAHAAPSQAIGAPGTPASPETYEYEVELPASGAADVEVAEIGRRLCLNLIDWPAASGDTTLWGQALDCDLLRAPLTIRNWRPGDAYRPRGRRSVHKLKELFLDRRIAAPLRRSWPVLTSADQVIWVRQIGPAEDFSAGAATRRAIVITEQAL